MNATSFARRTASIVLPIVIVALSATMAWAAANDYRSRGLIPNGVSVVGEDISGLTEVGARDAILRTVGAPLLRPVSLVADGRMYRFDPRSAVSVDVNAMLEDAYAARRKASYSQRLVSSLTGMAPRTEVTPAFSVDEAALDAWIDGVADGVDVCAVDASLTVVDSRVRIRPAQTGRRLERETAAAALRDALDIRKAFGGDNRTIEVPVTVVEPRVTAEDFGKTIVVDVSERRIRLFNGIRIEETYPCAVGTPGYPTPKGVFEIVQKRYMPTWVNPAPDGWGVDMPASIPPGPGNPLGTRAMNLSAPGIRFHGTTKTGSIGTAASHGCMRMLRADIEDFYERVSVGTRVYIVD